MWVRAAVLLALLLFAVIAPSRHYAREAPGDERTTRTLVLEQRTTEAVAPIVEAWIAARWDGSRPRLIEDRHANQLVVVGVRARVSAVVEFVARLDVRSIACGGARSQVLVLEHRTAKEVVPLLRRALAWHRGFVDAFSERGPSSPPPVIEPAPHSAHLLAVGTTRDLESIERMMKKLDVAGGPTSSQSKIWNLEHRRADRVAKLLRNQLGPDGLRVDWDEYPNQVIATGPPRLVAQTGAIVTEIDVPHYICRCPATTYTLKHRSVQSVMPVVRGVAAYVATLRSLDPYENPHPPPVVIPDPVHNQLVAFDTRGDFQAILRVLDYMDIDPAPRAKAKSAEREVGSD